MGRARFPKTGATPCVAVTGGVGCGKSEVGRLLAERGAEVVDADQVVHRLQAPGGELSEVVAREFGAQYLAPDGSVDRSKLAAHVFTQSAELARLNACSHPIVRRWFQTWRGVPTEQWAKVALIPLLFESGWEADWDLTVCVVCRPELQRERLRTRGWTEEEAQRRIDAQWPLAAKQRRADLVIDNSGDWRELTAAAESLMHTLVEMKTK